MSEEQDRTVVFEDAHDDIAVINEHDLTEAAQGLVALMAVQPVTGRTAARELLEIHARNQSTAYLQLLAHHTIDLAGTYALEDADPAAVGVIIRNLQSFILSYRSLRPVTQDGDRG